MTAFCILVVLVVISFLATQAPEQQRTELKLKASPTSRLCCALKTYVLCACADIQGSG